MTSDTTTVASDRYVVAAQGRQTTSGRRGSYADMEGRGGYTGGHGGTMGERGGPRGGQGDDSVVYCYYYKEVGHTKY